MASFTARESTALDHPEAAYAAIEAHGGDASWIWDQKESRELQLKGQLIARKYGFPYSEQRIRRLVNELDALEEAAADWAINDVLRALEAIQPKTEVPPKEFEADENFTERDAERFIDKLVRRNRKALRGLAKLKSRKS